jgi:hypothetical protein
MAMFPRTLAAAIALGLGVVPVWAQAQDTTTSQDSLTDLRDEIRRAEQRLESLNQRLDALERAQGRTPPPRATAQTPTPGQTPGLTAAQSPPNVAAGAPSILPPRDSVSDPSIAASRENSLASPTDPELKGFIAIPGTETMIRIGGYAKLDAIATNRPAGDDDQFITSEFPVDGVHRDTPNFNIHAKQTRFSIEARRPTTRGVLRFYLENDFFGSADGYEFRLRHAYGQLGNTYAGYGYSSFMDPDSLPNTLDFEGPGSAPYLTVAGIHHIFSMGKGNTLTLAAEAPQSQIYNLVGDDIAVERLPDVTLAARMERGWGHLQLSGVARSVGYDGDNELGEDLLGGGLQLSGSINANENNLWVFGMVAGKGIARYTTDIGGSGYDAAIGPDGDLVLLTSYGGFFGYTHNWNQDWSSNLVFGQLNLSNNDDVLAGDAFKRSRYSALNLLWSPSPTWTMGVELLFGQLLLQDGRDADVMRLQGSVQYSFVK